MRRRRFIYLGMSLTMIGANYLMSCTPVSPGTTARPVAVRETVQLAAPVIESEMSLAQALLKRRSIRSYGDGALTLAEISQVLWAGQGITDEQGHRTAPSAGALYPLEVYLVAKRVDGLPAGLYHFEPQAHALTAVALDDRSAALTVAAGSQQAMAEAAAVVVLAAVIARTATRYGERAPRYVHMEVGSVAQNGYLQACSLGLGTVIIGAFDDDEVQQVLGLPAGESPMALLPMGRLVSP